MERLKNILYNGCIALNGLLVFLVVFESAVEVPLWLQVGGRLHPMLLHFPITLLVLAVFWEVFFTKLNIIEKVVIGDGLLFGASLSAVLTAIMGFLLSREGGYDADAIWLHKWTGVSVAIASLLWYSTRNQIRKKQWRSFTIGGLILAIVTIAGHEGSIITHGENFILEPISLANKEKVLLDDAYTYEHVVMPILEEKCFGCHNEKKAKGGLVMNPIDKLLKGGDNGILWDTLDQELGLLMHHLNLPIEDDVHMPPKGKPQLSENEKQLIYYWVKAGADFEQKVIDLLEADTLRMIASSFLNTIEGDTYIFDAANDDIIKQLNSDYRLVEPLALHSPALQVEFFGAAFFKKEQLTELQKISEQIVSLNLNRIPVTDDDLEVIASFKNLRKLSLSGTEISGATLSELGVLAELRQLTLTGTTISSDDLQVLSQLEKLAILFVWDTQLTNDDVEKLRKQFPAIRIESGFTGQDLITKLSPPQFQEIEEIFTDETVIKLKHFIKGADIRYTLDGSEPDSLFSNKYDGAGITISKPLQLRARAYLKGWISSDLLIQNFFKAGFNPDSILLVKSPNPDYDGLGGQTLFDLRKGTSNFKTPHWLGYRENPLVLDLFFDKPVELSSVTISCLIDLNSYIFPGAQFEIWSEDINGKRKLLSTLQPKQPSSLTPSYLTSYIMKFGYTQVSRIQIIGKPVGTLPNWHPGKGDKAWLFVDEIFLN